MTSPLAKGLFNKVIAHSGTVLSRLIEPDMKQAEASGAKFVQRFGVTDIAALRRMPAQQLIKTMMADATFHTAEPRGPVVDGYVFPEQPSLVFQAGREAKVLLILGNTSRDGDEDSMGVSGTPKADKTLADKTRPQRSCPACPKLCA